MNKSERLNDMIRYLNNCEFFNLNDLMKQYNISKSTALRDIHSLEKLGMPIYAEHGRYGRYGILKNRLLAPITFNVDEMDALYFAMLTLENYQSTPFHISVDKLKDKFENCVSPKQLKQMNRMKKVLQLEGNKHHQISQYLDKVLLSILNEHSCKIKYKAHSQSKSYHVQFFRISAKFGQWYVAGIEYETDKYRVFRCDRITSIKENNTQAKYTVEQLMDHSIDKYQTQSSIRFEVEISANAMDIFYKENYPSMYLIEGDKTFIKGFYNKGEEKFIADYFMKYGNYVKSVRPTILKHILQERAKELLNYYKEI